MTELEILKETIKFRNSSNQFMINHKIIYAERNEDDTVTIGICTHKIVEETKTNDQGTAEFMLDKYYEKLKGEENENS